MRLELLRLLSMEMLNFRLPAMAPPARALAGATWWLLMAARSAFQRL